MSFLLFILAGFRWKEDITVATSECHAESPLAGRCHISGSVASTGPGFISCTEGCCL